MCRFHTSMFTAAVFWVMFYGTYSIHLKPWILGPYCEQKVCTRIHLTLSFNNILLRKINRGKPIGFQGSLFAITKCLISSSFQEI